MPASITTPSGFAAFRALVTGGTSSGYVSSVEHITAYFAPLSAKAFAASSGVWNPLGVDYVEPADLEESAYEVRPYLVLTSGPIVARKIFGPEPVFSLKSALALRRASKCSTALWICRGLYGSFRRAALAHRSAESRYSSAPFGCFNELFKCLSALRGAYFDFFVGFRRGDFCRSFLEDFGAFARGLFKELFAEVCVVVCADYRASASVDELLLGFVGAAMASCTNPDSSAFTIPPSASIFTKNSQDFAATSFVSVST